MLSPNADGEPRVNRDEARAQRGLIMTDWQEWERDQALAREIGRQVRGERDIFPAAHRLGRPSPMLLSRIGTGLVAFLITAVWFGAFGLAAGIALVLTFAAHTEGWGGASAATYWAVFLTPLAISTFLAAAISLMVARAD